MTATAQRFGPAAGALAVGALAVFSTLQLVRHAGESNEDWAYGLAVCTALGGGLIVIGLVRRVPQARLVATAVLTITGVVFSIFAFWYFDRFGFGPPWWDAVALCIGGAVAGYGAAILLWKGR